MDYRSKETFKIILPYLGCFEYSQLDVLGYKLYDTPQGIQYEYIVKFKNF